MILYFIIEDLKILFTEKFSQTPLNIAMNLSEHLCSAEASTNGEFHLHNAKRKQYSSILHSLSHKLWNCNILNIHSIEIQSKIRQSKLQAAEPKDETPGGVPFIIAESQDIENDCILSLPSL